MPKFIIYNANLKLMPEDMERLQEITKAGVVDQYGVKQLEVYFNEERGGVWCIWEGPDEDAIHNHNAEGISLDGLVREVDAVP
ncbi:MAG: hypothetical protein JW395_1951 [Nitrospira sp.]|nr:hypothetical protein [Nitrospira sp.]